MENKWRTMLAKKKQAKVVVLEKDFAGIKAGSKLYVATPKVIDEYIRGVPSGQVRTIERLRNELARKNRCTATCPVSTAIFMRISAEAALEELAEGKSLNEVAPFWRVIDPDSKLANRLTVGPEWVAAQRAAEGDGSAARKGNMLELEAALAESRADLEAGKFVKETSTQHLRRLAKINKSDQ